MKPEWCLAIACSFGLLTGCSHVEPAQGGALANGPPGPSWEPDTREPVSAPPPAPSELDHDTAWLVRRTLKEDPTLAPIAKELKIRVNKGVVSLQGRVASPQDRVIIKGKLSKLPGVDAITDQLKISN